MVSGLIDVAWVVAEGIDPDLILATNITMNACHTISQKLARGSRPRYAAHPSVFLSVSEPHHALPNSPITYFLYLRDGEPCAWTRAMGRKSTASITS